MNGVGRDSKGRAQRLLIHYITLVMEESGLKPDSDTTAELNELVEHLIDASCVEMEARIMKSLQLRFRKGGVNNG